MRSKFTKNIWNDGGTRAGSISMTMHWHILPLSADAILCLNCYLCKCSKDVNHRKFDISENIKSR
jgi:hypothetical protein